MTAILGIYDELNHEALIAADSVVLSGTTRGSIMKLRLSQCGKGALGSSGWAGLAQSVAAAFAGEAVPGVPMGVAHDLEQAVASACVVEDGVPHMARMLHAAACFARQAMFLPKDAEEAEVSHVFAASHGVYEICPDGTVMRASHGAGSLVVCGVGCGALVAIGAVLGAVMGECARGLARWRAPTHAKFAFEAAAKVSAGVGGPVEMWTFSPGRSEGRGRPVVE